MEYLLPSLTGRGKGEGLPLELEYWELQAIQAEN